MYIGTYAYQQLKVYLLYKLKFCQLPQSEKQMRGVRETEGTVSVAILSTKKMFSIVINL